jgi:hypothetical protein
MSSCFLVRSLSLSHGKNLSLDEKTDGGELSFAHADPVFASFLFGATGSYVQSATHSFGEKMLLMARTSGGSNFQCSPKEHHLGLDTAFSLRGGVQKEDQGIILLLQQVATCCRRSC